MSPWVKRALLAGACFMLFAMAYAKWTAMYDRQRVLVRFPDGTQVSAEVVTTSEDHARGLSGRTGLGENEGMLFDFPSATTPEFWMKEMLFSIDVAWIDNGVIIDMDKNVAPPDAGEPPARMQPSAAVTQVLELPAGFLDAHTVRRGDVLTVSIE